MLKLGLAVPPNKLGLDSISRSLLDVVSMVAGVASSSTGALLRREPPPPNNLPNRLISFRPWPSESTDPADKAACHCKGIYRQKALPFRS